MGNRGPVPKRSGQRRRRNTPETEIDKAPGAADVKPPEPPENWHPVARDWYLSLAESGQAVFYQPSDWMTAYLIAESMSRELKPQVVGTSEDGEPVYAEVPMKGASLAAYLRAMTVLLVTEGDRRRVKVELEQTAEIPDDSIPNLDDYRDRLSG